MKNLKTLGLLGLVWVCFLAGCQLAPTKIIETRDHEVQKLVNKADERLRLTPETQIVDARSAFEFAMTHLPNSVHINWKHYAQNQAPAPGRLLPEPEKLARRLALKGLTPGQPVIVVGDALEGEASEGRIAWMLFYLGFEDVQTASISLFGEALTNIETPPRPNAPVWEPNLRAGVNLSRKEFISLLQERQQGRRVHVIDVRSKKEYFNRKEMGSYETPDLQAINIEWKEFFNTDGRPNLNLRDRLRGVGIGVEDRIAVISDQGVRSAAVTWALLAMGFTKAANYTGGYTELLRR